MVRCQHGGCTRQAKYNVKTPKSLPPRFCHQHKEDDMVYRSSPPCQQCHQQYRAAVYCPPGTKKPTRCSQHAPPDYIAVPKSKKGTRTKKSASGSQKKPPQMTTTRSGRSTPRVNYYQSSGSQSSGQSSGSQSGGGGKSHGAATVGQKKKCSFCDTPIHQTSKGHDDDLCDTCRNAFSEFMHDVPDTQTSGTVLPHGQSTGGASGRRAIQTKTKQCTKCGKIFYQTVPRYMIQSPNEPTYQEAPTCTQCHYKTLHEPLHGGSARLVDAPLVLPQLPIMVGGGASVHIPPPVQMKQRRCRVCKRTFKSMVSTQRGQSGQTPICGSCLSDSLR